MIYTAEQVARLKDTLSPEEFEQLEALTAPKQIVPGLPFEPHPGPQTAFFESQADITIYGGAAGGGKSWALTVNPLRHIDVPGFGAVIFRRTFAQIQSEQGIWDESLKWYRKVGGVPNFGDLKWKFPDGTHVSFAHCQFLKDTENYLSSQICYLEFDQLEQFEEKQFWDLLGRNRSTCGVRPQVFAGCNPSPQSWLSDLLDWWIDEDGWAIESRSGVMRWFARPRELNGAITWADTRQELVDKFPGCRPLSLVFIPSYLSDNPSMPSEYGDRIENMLPAERQRMGGNWRVVITDGMFNTAMLQIVDAVPREGRRVRYWDKAGSLANDAKYTAGVLLCESLPPLKLWYVEDVQRFRKSSLERNLLIKQVAERDREMYGYVPIWIEREPGSGGLESAETSVVDLAGYDINIERVTGNYLDRARGFAAQVCAGNVRLLRADWNRQFIAELAAQPQTKMCDQMDAAAGAFNKLTLVGGGGGPITIYTGTEKQGILAQLPRDVFPRQQRFGPDVASGSILDQLPPGLFE